jgi:C1A family cysteine protease
MKNRNSRFFAGLLPLAAISPLIMSCDGTGAGSGATVAVEELATPVLHRIGAIPESAETMRVKASAAPAALGPLVSSVDLSSELPPVGNQASEGSCVGWAVGYSTKTLQDVAVNHWLPDDGTHEFSPSWIYNQINGGQDRGSNISTALNLLVNSGIDTMSSFPYIDGDYLTQPSAASKSRASHFKVASWQSLAVSTQNFKSTIAAGNAVIIGFQVLPDMDAMNGTTNTVYDTDVGTRALRTYSPCGGCTGDCNGPGLCGTCSANTCTVPACGSNCSRGGHAVALIGYDDGVGAFKFINQWGATWNGNGYGWMAYSFITDADLGVQAFVMNPAADVPGIQDSPILWEESNLPLM